MRTHGGTWQSIERQNGPRGNFSDFHHADLMIREGLSESWDLLAVLLVGIAVFGARISLSFPFRFNNEDLSDNG
jgi:hypothetical protein